MKRINPKLPKTISARIENDLHEELIDRCNKVGCRVNDFRASIEFTLNDSVEFDFDIDHDNGEQQEQKTYYIPRNNQEEQLDFPLFGGILDVGFCHLCQDVVADYIGIFRRYGLKRLYIRRTEVSGGGYYLYAILQPLHLSPNLLFLHDF